MTMKIRVSDGERLVSDEIFFITPKECPPPKGVDMLLLTKYGKAIIGKWNDEDCVGYYPMPKRSKYKPR